MDEPETSEDAEAWLSRFQAEKPELHAYYNLLVDNITTIAEGWREFRDNRFTTEEFAQYLRENYDLRPQDADAVISVVEADEPYEYAANMLRAVRVICPELVGRMGL